MKDHCTICRSLEIKRGDSLEFLEFKGVNRWNGCDDQKYPVWIRVKQPHK